VFLGQCSEGRVQSSRLPEIITEGTTENTAVAIPSKKEQRLTRCGPAEGVSMTASRGRPKSKFLSAQLEFKSQSKTLLFVTHGPEALRGICERAIWLDHGHLLADGPFDEVLQKYEIACQ
jgi:ABC-type thiamine transport system ATPase subunit